MALLIKEKTLEFSVVLPAPCLYRPQVPLQVHFYYHQICHVRYHQGPCLLKMWGRTYI